MRIRLLSSFIFLLLSFLFAFVPISVNAQQCTGYRLCADCTNVCKCSISQASCSNSGVSCGFQSSGGTCQCEESCEGYFAKPCDTANNANSCLSTGGCFPSDDVTNTCEWGSGGYCGDTICNNGETNATCPQDCPAGGGPTCPNGICEAGENNASCPQDCQAPPNWGNCGQCAVSGGAPGTANWRDPNCASNLLVQNNGDAGAAASQNNGALPYCICDPGRCTAPTPPPCVPSCANSCGQSNGCTGSCPNTDSGTPGAVTFVSPSGGIVTLTNGIVSIGWNAVAKADFYRIRIRPQGSSCSDPGSVCTTTSNTNYSFAPQPAYGNAYEVQVMPVNNTCTVQNGSWAIRNFTIYSTVTGFIVQDDENDSALSGSYCQDANSGTLVSAGTGSSISANSGDHAGVFTGTGTYSISVPWRPNGSGSSNEVTLSPGTDGSGDTLTCICPTGCRYTGVPSPKNALNFYLNSASVSNAGWWQVQGGSVMAKKSGGRALESLVPDVTCAASATCTPAMIARDSTDLEESAGIAVTGGGQIDTSAANGVNTDFISDRTPQIYAQGTTLGSLTENYEYFYRQYSMGLEPADDFAGSAANAAKPSAAPLNGRAYFSSGDLTINQVWSVAASESIVVFIDGNLSITDTGNAQDLITVAPGGFLAFIVSGNITFDATVGNPNANTVTPNVEGVFISDGQIIIESNGGATPDDERFVGAGTFVGWSGFSLQRNWEDGGTGANKNNTRPIELFIFRPDFVENVPERMAKPHYIWQETQ